jgi:hypothetical protein
MSRPRVGPVKALEGVKPGDRIDISYTGTRAIDVVAPRKK